MASIFTQIVNGDLPSHKVAETRDFLAFLDVRPVSAGHTLVIPKQEIDYFLDLDDETYIGFNLFAREVAHLLQKTYEDKRIATSIIGLEVPHVHMHLIPISSLSDMDFSKAKEAEDGDLKAELEKIRSQR